MVPTSRTRYGTSERPGPGVKRPRRIKINHSTAIMSVATAPATGVPSNRFAVIVNPHSTTPEPAPTAAQNTFRRPGMLVAVYPFPAMMATAIPETTKGMRFIHPDTKPISVSGAPAASAAMSVPGPVEPQGPIIRPNSVSSAARYGVKPKDNSSGSPMRTETPKPRTDYNSGTTPCAIRSADATPGAPAESQPASRRRARVRSAGRESETPPPVIANTCVGVRKVSFQAATRFSTGVSKYQRAMMAALTVPRSGGMAAEIREKASKSSVTNTGTTAMNRPTLLLLQLEPLRPWSTSGFTGVPQGTSIAASIQAGPNQFKRPTVCGPGNGSSQSWKLRTYWWP